eukprot:gb/GEZN01007543.1/.p1 GENE.gb/GEZN01007543.1/~~gb/GEZN01007543.1/.p1  ORF type:complete len:431 (-),score=54.30 gb/GEZN01007543.1/:86-1378(-)
MKHRDQIRLRNAFLVLLGGVLLVLGTLWLARRESVCPVCPTISENWKDDPAAFMQKHNNSWLSNQGYFGSTGPNSNILIVSAYDGEKYITMGNLASDTKAMYSQLRGYHYSIDNDILQRKANNFNAKSAGRIDVYRKHWNKGYKWIVWTDGDVLITNPRFKLEDLIERYAPDGSGKHVIMARDWGGGQPQTGVMFLKCSAEGNDLLDEWEHQIHLDKIHDDLNAILAMENQQIEPYYSWMAWTIDMWELQSYPHLELKEHYNAKAGLEHSPRHALWESNDFMVHVVNCLRQSSVIDVASCDGIAAWYWNHFLEEVRAIESGDEKWINRTKQLKAADRAHVVKADYGTDENNIDVTKQTQVLLDNYWSRRDASARWDKPMKMPKNFNDVFGDPAPGAMKRFTATYHVGEQGEERTTRGEEWGDPAYINFNF